jgi:hypothetical protein
MGRLSIPSDPASTLSALQSRVEEIDRRVIPSPTLVGGLTLRLTQQEDHGKHAWSGSGSLPSVAVGAAFTQPTGYSTTTTAGIATLSGSSLLLNRPGRWALKWYVESDSTAANGDGGLSEIVLSWASGGWAPITDMLNSVPRFSGFAGAGRLRQEVAWSGWVDSGPAKRPITGGMSWHSSTGTGTAVAYYLFADYLGGPAS